jgi:hypothetical protein
MSRALKIIASPEQGGRYKVWAPVPGATGWQGTRSPANVGEARMALRAWCEKRGHNTVVYSQNNRCVTRVCADHGCVKVDAEGKRVYEACGMMWRTAEVNGWAVEERRPDAAFTGHHSRGPDIYMRKNAALEDDVTQKLVTKLMDEGKQPKAIHTELKDTAFEALSPEEQADVELGRSLGQVSEVEKVALLTVQNFVQRWRIRQCAGFKANSVNDLNEYVRDHSYPNLYVEEMQPLTEYAVKPDPADMERYGMEESTMQALVLVTKESMLSLRHHLRAIGAAGFNPKKLALDMDGKWKLVREGWVFVSLGGRMVVMDARNNRPVQTFVPFCWLVAPAERWDLNVYAYLALEVRIAIARDSMG